MQDKKVLVIGCGKIGGRVARRLTSSFQVFGLRRTPQTQTSGIQYISADVCNKDKLKDMFQSNFSDGVDYLLYCLTPSTRDEQSYRKTYVEGLTNVLNTLPQQQRLKRLIFVSSSSVYHQNDDNWINEQSPCEPTSFSGKLILEAENLLRACQLPSTIIRFSGIYGGNRRQLIKQISKSAEVNTPILSHALRRTNRIHEDDCVGFIEHLISEADQGKELEQTYLASDSEPVDLNEVIVWLADKLGLNICPEMTDQARRRSGNKKCSNQKMLDSGYKLRFANFRDGYTDMISKA